jgi:hypothetical protein
MQGQFRHFSFFLVVITNDLGPAEGSKIGGGGGLRKESYFRNKVCQGKKMGLPMDPGPERHPKFHRPRGCLAYLLSSKKIALIKCRGSRLLG